MWHKHQQGREIRRVEGKQRVVGINSVLRSSFQTLGSCCALNLNLSSQSLATLEVAKEQSGQRSVQHWGLAALSIQAHLVWQPFSMAPWMLPRLRCYTQTAASSDAEPLVSPSPPSPAASYTWRDEGCRFGTVDFSPSPSAVFTTAAPGVQAMCKLCGREAEFICNLHDLVGTLFTQVQKGRLSLR